MIFTFSKTATNINQYVILNRKKQNNNYQNLKDPYRDKMKIPHIKVAISDRVLVLLTLLELFQHHY